MQVACDGMVKMKKSLPVEHEEKGSKKGTGAQSCRRLSRLYMVFLTFLWGQHSGMCATYAQWGINEVCNLII